MNLHVNKDLIKFFKQFISSYNIAIRVRKNYFNIFYFKGICELILPYFVKTKLIRNYVVNVNEKKCQIFLGYNNYGFLKSRKIQLFNFRKSFYKINKNVFLNNSKVTKYFFNHDYYFLFNRKLYNLKDLKDLKVNNKKDIIYVIFKVS